MKLKQYYACITLSTQTGELPSSTEVQRLVMDQMQGELDEHGLRCDSVIAIVTDRTVCDNRLAEGGEQHE